MKSEKWAYFSLFGLFAVIVLLGLQSISAPPLLDDVEQIAHIQGIESIGELFGSDCYGFFRPVKNLTFFALSRLAPDTQVAGHTLSLLIYLTATGLVIYLFSVLLEDKMLAVAAGAIWALAPTQISVIAWLSCVNVLIMATALLAALAAYENSQTPGSGAPKRSAPAFLLTAGAFYLVALYSYESAIVFPALIVLWDLLRKRRPLRSRWSLLSHALFWVLTLAYLTLRLGAVGSDLAINNLSFSPMSRGQVSFASAYFVFEHLLMWLWPFGKQTLMAGIFIWGKSATLSQLILCWIALLLIAVLVLRIRRAAPLITFGVVWFLVAFLPTSNLIPVKNGPFSDYYLVVPSLGLALALTGLFRYLRATVYARKALSRAARYSVLALCVLLGCWRIAAASIGFGWANLWNSEIELFRRFVIARPYNFTAKASLARCYILEGRLDEAEKLARESLTEAPWFVNAYYALGNVYVEKGLYREARETLTQALRLNPEAPYPYIASGFIYETFLNDTIRAKENYRKVLSLPWSQFSAEAALNLSRLLAVEGNLDEAIEIMETALKRVPLSAELHYNAAVAYRQKGDLAAAQKHLDSYNRLRNDRE